MRFLGFVFAALTVLFMISGVAAGYMFWRNSQDLPEISELSDYAPPIMTRVYADNGALMAEFARERRLFTPIENIPPLVRQAFLSAEDQNFYSHHGIDIQGVIRASLDNLSNVFSGRRLVGASTITQQVTKNMLLSSDVELERKIKEAILAWRIEQALSKDQILEIYLNEIYLGYGAHGVTLAALAYFDKHLDELTLAETAYLAGLPKGPNNYHPQRHRERAIARRNWVIGRMVEDGAVTAAEGAAAAAEPLTVARSRKTELARADYAVEEIRSALLDRFGDDDTYGGGLTVRSTIDVTLQDEARRALRAGLMRYDSAQRWRGPVTTISLEGDWRRRLADVHAPRDLDPWRLAVVLGADARAADIGFAHPSPTPAEIAVNDIAWARRGARADQLLKPGDVVFVEKAGEDPRRYALRQIPAVDGAIVAIDPRNGRVLAMVGGFSHDASEFNRASQALRQPGSAFKPFVYMAALENGYSPVSIVTDGPIVIDQGPSLGLWKPKNYVDRYYGPSTLRLGIEKSRNLMTVRLAQAVGMKTVADMAQRFGVVDHLKPMLAMSLGSGETTLLRLTNAYAMIANGGRRIDPSLIDRVQDRYGRTVWRHAAFDCIACAESAAGDAPPALRDNRAQIIDAMTAFQMTSMLEGVATRGTAAFLGKLNLPLAGKTGTTNDARDAWFIGFSPTLVAGVFVGYDTPRSLGHKASGGGIAAPIFADFMKVALADAPTGEFVPPAGMEMIPVYLSNGRRAPRESGKGVILEAFKPGEGPEVARPVAEAAVRAGGRRAARRASPAYSTTSSSKLSVQVGTGGLY